MLVFLLCIVSVQAITWVLPTIPNARITNMIQPNDTVHNLHDVANCTVYNDTTVWVMDIATAQQRSACPTGNACEVWFNIYTAITPIAPRLLGSRGPCFNSTGVDANIIPPYQWNHDALKVILKTSTPTPASQKYTLAWVLFGGCILAIWSRLLTLNKSEPPFRINIIHRDTVDILDRKLKIYEWQCNGVMKEKQNELDALTAPFYVEVQPMSYWTYQAYMALNAWCIVWAFCMATLSTFCYTSYALMMIGFAMYTIFILCYAHDTLLRHYMSGRMGIYVYSIPLIFVIMRILIGLATTKADSTELVFASRVSWETSRVCVQHNDWHFLFIQVISGLGVGFTGIIAPICLYFGSDMNRAHEILKKQQWGHVAIHGCAYVVVQVMTWFGQYQYYNPQPLWAYNICYVVLLLGYNAALIAWMMTSRTVDQRGLVIMGGDHGKAPIPENWTSYIPRLVRANLLV